MWPQVLLPLEKVLPDPCPPACILLVASIGHLLLYDSGVFQAVASALRPGANLDMSIFQFPTAFGSPCPKPCWSSKPGIMEVCLPHARTLGWGGLGPPHSLVGTSKVVIYPSHSLVSLWGCMFWLDHVSALFPFPTWPFLYILSCRKSVLLVLRSFSEIVFYV